MTGKEAAKWYANMRSMGKLNRLEEDLSRNPRPHDEFTGRETLNAGV